ncbi:glycosyltransferase [Bacillus dakarensis]|uniref:glycosyltransferase n=1 Tax=Robertmurraya dakarensis TaxID=1926278 RepID=UPI000980D23F|nr:glycosyltransferase [Bacillus dakarensis]
MKKKILFMLINMNIGGTEKALLNMISEMPKEKYDITLLMLEEYGGLLNSIPQGVKVKYLKGYDRIKETINNPPQVSAIEFLKKGRIIDTTSLITVHLITKMKKERSLFYKYILRNYPVLEEEYDAAVAYAGPMDLISYFVIHKIKAKKKIQWIHFDITKIGFNKKFAERIYRQFDKIFVVSNEGKQKLIELIPSLKYKTEKFLNFLSQEQVLRLAEEGCGFQDDFCGYRILTVGRLSKEKGQDLTIKVLAKLKEDGYNVRWYCIGEGRERKEYERLIKEHNLEDDFFLLGAKENPYPFMKQCDIYVQPSRHEGYCITLAEVRCLNRPIIATDFTGAKEQIKNGETGIIVPIDVGEIYHGINRLLRDKTLRENLSYNLANKNISSLSKDIQKITFLL